MNTNKLARFVEFEGLKVELYFLDQKQILG